MKLFALRSHASRVPVAGVVGLVAGCMLVATASASALNSVNTESSFQFPAGTGNLTTLTEPLYFYQTSADLNWVQDTDIGNGTGADAASLYIAGEQTESNGSLNALLVFRVNGTGLTTSPIASGVACSTQPTFVECYTSVNIPSGTQVDALKLVRTFEDANGNYWWDGALIEGSSQINAGLIDIPLGNTGVVSSDGVYNLTQSQTNPSCSAIPESNVSWLSPNNGTAYGTYTGSLNAGTCPAQFTALNLGGEVTGVNVVAPLG